MDRLGGTKMGSSISVQAVRLGLYALLIGFSGMFAMSIRDMPTAATYFPYMMIALVGGIGAVLALSETVSLLRQSSARRSMDTGVDETRRREAAHAEQRISVLPVLKTTAPLVLITALYIFAISRAGTLVATVTYVLAVALILGARSWWKIGLMLVLMGLSLVFLFQGLLQVRLP